MYYKKRWSPSKTAKKEFAQKMQEISEFCAKNGIEQSTNGDSYYFTLNGINYRISNHTIEASNRGAYDELTGEKKRELYHEKERKKDTVYIHASKTRIIEIYNNLKNGFELDGKGNKRLGD